jgi:quercetin dioxygenase-like cupin family protein
MVGHLLEDVPFLQPHAKPAHRSTTHAKRRSDVAMTRNTIPKQETSQSPASQDLTRRDLLAQAAAIGMSIFTAPIAAAVAQTTSASQQPARGTLDIKRNGSQPASRGNPQWFTGEVLIDQPFQADEPARVGGATVTFEPGARTAWHTHPLVQTLFVTFGLGWIQRAGGPIEEIRPGDVVWIPPGEKHWHGASPTAPMTHIAVVERLNGKNIDWLEKVSDEQYRR